MQYSKTPFISKLFFLVFFNILLTYSPAYPDQVIPSNRVTSRLNLRKQPDINSPVVGTLSRNESAKLIKRGEYWYHVKLNNGTQGYVSKAWIQIISDTSGETGNVIRLGSWNVKKLGHGESKNYTVVAKVIENNFDVLVVVEVMQKESGHPGYDTLLSVLGMNWAGMVTDSPRPNTTEGNCEFYGILYRRTLVRPCSGWNSLVYFKDNDGSETGTGENIFEREPAYACFEAPVENATVGIDFLLAAYHARYKGGKDLIKAEARTLGDVFKNMKKSRPGEKDLIIAGDFNLQPMELEQETNIDVKTQGTASTLNSEGELSANLYDHMLVFDERATSEMVGTPTVIDVRNIVANHEVFFDTVSDHLPIVVKLRSSGPDDD